MAGVAASLGAWEHFIKGLDTNDMNEFNEAETFHKTALVYDLRVGDIIHHTAVSKNMPYIP